MKAVQLMQAYSDRVIILRLLSLESLDRKLACPQPFPCAHRF